MDKKLLNKYPYRIQQLIKDEASFAYAISARYKMSNTRNKDFVNCILIYRQDIEKYYSFDKLKEELNKLEYHVVKANQYFSNLNDNLYLVVNKSEKRELYIKKIFTVEQFL